MYTKRGSAPGAASTISAAGRGTWRAFQVVFRLAQSVTLAAQWDGDYEREERTFARLLDDPELDARSRRASDGDVREVEQALALALASAYGGPENGLVPVPHAAHRFLQRVLYRINRLTLFWYDDLGRYRNERSTYLHEVRARIESAWQAWELFPHPIAILEATDARAGLRARAAQDVHATPSAAGAFFRDQASVAAYRHLVAIASLDGLVEASQLSRTLGGVGNSIHATLTKLLVEEYGGGRLAKKHSTYFRTMLEALDMRATPEAYFDLVPWEVLACINQSFLLSDRKRHFLRYVGGLLYTETSVPAAFRCYQAAARRLGLPEAARRYWDLHITEDARHGPWMLEDVALPLVDRYLDDAWELLLGYDQQRRMSARASTATARAAAAADADR